MTPKIYLIPDCLVLKGVKSRHVKEWLFQSGIKLGWEFAKNMRTDKIFLYYTNLFTVTTTYYTSNSSQYIKVY
jgi:hypothetical protein